jgi:hypothetical protein
MAGFTGVISSLRDNYFALLLTPGLVSNKSVCVTKKTVSFLLEFKLVFQSFGGVCKDAVI